MPFSNKTLSSPKDTPFQRTPPPSLGCRNLVEAGVAFPQIIPSPSPPQRGL